MCPLISTRAVIGQFFPPCDWPAKFESGPLTSTSFVLFLHRPRCEESDKLEDNQLQEVNLFLTKQQQVMRNAVQRG